MVNWKKVWKKGDRQQKLICLSNLARTDKTGGGKARDGRAISCYARDTAMPRKKCSGRGESEWEREKVYIGGSRLVAVLQRRSRVLLTSPKTKCKLTRRPLDVYSAPRIPPREIRESFSLSFNNNRACNFLSLERHRVLRISLTCPVTRS